MKGVLILKKWRVLFNIFLPVVLGGIVGLLTSGSMDYQMLELPPLAPPGFIFPIVGLILYLILKDTKPKNAKSAGKGALISVITGVVIYVAIMVLFGIIFNVMASNL